MQYSAILLYGEVPDVDTSTYQPNDQWISRFHTIIRTSAEKHGGRLEGLTDHNCRVSFSIPENAIRVAKDLNRSFSEDPRIPFRIGIGCGINPENKDGVAEKLGKICTEGAVLASRGYVEQTSAEVQAKFQYVGKTLLKDKQEPVEVYSLLDDGLYVPSQFELTQRLKHANSIAVLPFHNTSDEQALDYVCEGIAEEVIDRLTQVKDLYVTARSSSFLFKNKSASILEISRKLNVSYVLDGSIRKRNDEYRISYQLVDATTGYNLLSEGIRSDFDHLYDAEKQISDAVLSQFRIQPEEEELKKEFYIHPEAYNHYLKGKHLAYQWTAETVKDAAYHYNKALEIISDYSLAYSGLSILNIHSAINGFVDPKTGFAKALEYADMAINSDASRHEGYVAKALVTFWMGNWYLPDFEDNLKKALQISPSNSEIRMFNGMLFLFKGDRDRAIIELKLAKSLDPYSVPVTIRLGLVQYMRREYEDAFNTFLTLQDEPNYGSYTSMRLAWCCIQLGQYERGIQHLKDAKKDHPYFNMILGSKLVIYHNLKNEKKYYQYKEEIERQDSSDPAYYYNHAILNKLLNKPLKAIECLEKALEDNMMRFAFIQFDEFWKDLWDIPEFNKLVSSTYAMDARPTIEISSETSETLKLNPVDLLFVEAQDNYSLLVYLENGKRQETILRATLSFIENQLEGHGFIRTHRSYLVNKEAGFEYSRRENKGMLHHTEVQEPIPVSRAKEKEVRAAFRN